MNFPRYIVQGHIGNEWSIVIPLTIELNYQVSENNICKLINKEHQPVKRKHVD